MSTTDQKRSQMTPITSRARVYFAPVDPITNAPTIFDPSKFAGLDEPADPWIDLGWIENFKRTATTRWQTAQLGAKGALGEIFRSQLGVQVEFEFCQWGKLQMALAAGSEQMNVLAAETNVDLAPCGGAAILPTAVLEGSTATELILGEGAVNSFAVGELIAVDQDYQQQVGYVGTGIAAAYVGDPVEVLRDRDYVRRITFNVSRISEKTSNSLILSQPLLGGIPGVECSVQKVTAFLDREGGRFLQQWSALFVFESVSGGKVCFFYPRLQCCGSAKESEHDIGEGFQRYFLKANFSALSLVDSTDNQEVVCYRSYFPAANAAVY